VQRIGRSAKGAAETNPLPLAGESGHNLKVAIASVERQLRGAAANMESEGAARLRDELKHLREQDLGI
jgi:excinuclease ABC subunit B